MLAWFYANPRLQVEVVNRQYGSSAPNRVRGLMRCPVCELELGVERQAGEVALRYSFKDWVNRCSCQRGDPALC